MLATISTNPASLDKVTLYCLMGEAMCMIQHLEDALSHAITLKKHVEKPGNMLLETANEFLEKYRSYTLGQAIKLTKAENLFPNTLQRDLESFLSERNWLIHKCISKNRDEMDPLEGKNRLFHRIQSITEKTQILLVGVEEDLMHFSESKGLDMSSVRETVQKLRRV